MKKLLAFVICVIMVTSMVAYAATTPSAWAQPEINPQTVSFLEALEVDMDYQRPITRKEFAYLAVDVYARLGGNIEQTAANPFQDCDDMFVLAAYMYGIVKGTSDVTFDPDALVTRQEICVMLSRVLKNTGKDYSDMPDAVNSYADAASVADWAKNETGFAISKGIMKGRSETEIAPLGNCTIEEALVLTARMENAYK